MGNIVSRDLSDTQDVRQKTWSFISSVNKLNCKFHSVPANVRSNLLQTYCCAWYGCQIWRFDSKQAGQLNTEWNKSVRRTLNLPYRTHTELLPHLVGNSNFSTQHIKRFVNFFDNMLHSENKHVRFIAQRALQNTNGVLGLNRAYCDVFTGVRFTPGMRVKKVCIPLIDPSSQAYVTAETIKQLLDVRDGLSIIDGFDMDDVSTIISSLCCN